MRFHSAKCVICGDYRFEVQDVVAYRLHSVLKTSTDRSTKLVPEQVDLDGDDPWLGVRCLCLSCVRFVASLMPSDCLSDALPPPATVDWPAGRPERS